MEEIKEQQRVEESYQTTSVDQPQKRRNSIGKAGFVFALLGFIFSWLAMLGCFFWSLGLILSFIGVFKKPRALAIAGLVISCGALILLILVMGVVASMSVMMALL